MPSHNGGTEVTTDGLQGWFIFTTLLLLCTLKSTVAFFFLFFTLDLAFLLLGIGYLYPEAGGPNMACNKAGGYFGLFAAFLAWYNALAGIADDSNSFFIIPVIRKSSSQLPPQMHFFLGHFEADFRMQTSRGL